MRYTVEDFRRIGFVVEQFVEQTMDNFRRSSNFERVLV